MCLMCFMGLLFAWPWFDVLLSCPSLLMTFLLSLSSINSLGGASLSPVRLGAVLNNDLSDSARARE